MEKAVRRGDLKAVEECIRVRSYWSSWKTDATILFLAIEKGYEDITLVLLSAQTLCWGDLKSALDMASDKGWEEVVQELNDRLLCLLQAGTSCKRVLLTQEQLVALCRRAYSQGLQSGDMSAVWNLLGRGCHVSTLSQEEQENLLVHSFGTDNGKFVGDMLVVQALLQNVPVSILSSNKQEQLLFCACREGDMIIANTLITNGCNINCYVWAGKKHYGRTRCTPLMVAAFNGHEEIVKKLILANATVGLQDSNGLTALHHAAVKNHIQCGILLAEGGASLRTKDNHSKTPIDVACTTTFSKAIKQAASFTTRRSLCVIGNAGGGKSTLNADVKTERNSIFEKIYNRCRTVKDNRKRTAGIEPIPHYSQKYGEVLFFDFAGQHEYHGPHQMFLESLLSKPGVPMTLLLVVKATDNEEAILHQLHRWLTPVALMANTASYPEVIVIGSFLDKVKSKKEAAAKLTTCIGATRKDLEELPLEVVGSCLLNCCQPQSEGMDRLCRYIEEVPVPEFGAAHTPYSLAWVLSQIRSTPKAQAVQLQEFSKWMQDNKYNLPQTMPPPEEVCRDLSAAGHALYLPNKADPSKSWLVLDLPGILHDVYGTLFSRSKAIVNDVGLVHCQDLAEFFPHLDLELVQQLLLSLEFCIPVDPSVLNLEVSKLTRSEDASGWLFFPALISAKLPRPTSGGLLCQSTQYLCWQLTTSRKHSISARVLQTILLRLAAHFVVQQCNEEGVQQLCCSIWSTGITWQSKRGVDITVHITNNRTIQVAGASDTSADRSFGYTSDVISDIVSTVHRLSPNLAAAAYIAYLPKGLHCMRMLQPIPLMSCFLWKTFETQSQAMKNTLCHVRTALVFPQDFRCLNSLEDGTPLWRMLIGSSGHSLNEASLSHQLN